jgi:hypothetical protein
MSEREHFTSLPRQPVHMRTFTMGANVFRQGGTDGGDLIGFQKPGRRVLRSLSIGTCVTLEQSARAHRQP